MSASRIYPGSTITLQTIVKQGGTPVNAAEITFKWRIGSGKTSTVTPTNTATGTYTATFTIPTDESGLLKYRWDTDGDLDFAQEGALLVEPSSFDNVSSTDYQ